MRAIILLNGEPYRGEIDGRDAYVYCCDGGYEWAKNRIKIDENLGDYDSLDYTPEPPPAEIYPTEKDATDGEIALRRALARGFSQIEIYGGGGGREDHFLGNLHLLYLAREQGASAVMITNYARMFVAEGETLLRGERGKTVSLFPFGGEAHILNSSGFYYPLPKSFSYGSTRGVSNVVVADEAFFTVRGKVLVAINCLR